MELNRRLSCYDLTGLLVLLGGWALVAATAVQAHAEEVRAAAKTNPAADGRIPTPTHWAYIKPVRPNLPKVRNTERVSNPIDYFVLAQLEKEGLSPSLEADRHTLIRRVSLDLTGLPPTLEETRAFVNDQNPDAYVKLVDRLLGSPAYGERWAQLWLDLARYADSQGYEKDNRRTIWRYRDWVIESLNNDTPFDQFTIEQIAGDLLPNPTLDQLIATAFHRNTMTNTEGGTDDEEFRVAAVVDRVNTTMQVWMGTTMGCAQCHSHKYDPITQLDYYRFFAFFNNTEDSDRGDEYPTVLAPTREQQEKISPLKAEIARLQKVLDTQTPELDASQARWEKTLAGQAVSWTVLEPVSFTSARGADLSKLDDGSVLAGGKSPATDTYTVVLNTDLRGITAVRLELLPHESLPKHGPGRHEGDGGLVLNELRVTAAPKVDSSNAQAIALGHPTAAPDQAEPGDGRVEQAIDGDAGRESGWAIHGQPGKRQVAVFETKQDVEFEGGGTLTFVFEQTGGKEHTIGRLRVSATTAPRPVRATRLPDHLVNTLAIAPGQRTCEQMAELAKYYRSIAPTLKSVRERLAQLDKQLVAIKLPKTPIMRELPPEKRRTTHVHIRGSFLDKGERVDLGVPAVFHPMPRSAPISRLGAAMWLVDNDNPLTARVMMNRLWEQLFGTGLVETSEDFGTQGERPSHPELLDWLASEFMRRNWSMKAMQRLIVTSATYRQSSRVRPDLHERDPYNRLLARGPRFRMDAERIRDQALAVSGLLSRKMFGSSVMPPQPEGVWQIVYSRDKWITSAGEDKYRRGLYTFWRRTTPHPSMVTFDAPSREYCVMRRIRTNTPLQALVTLNDPAYVEASQALALRIMAEADGGVEDRAGYGFRLCLARPPRSHELEQLVALYRSELEHFRNNKEAAEQVAIDTPGAAAEGLDVTELAAWTVVSNVLLNLDEMLTKR